MADVPIPAAELPPNLDGFVSKLVEELYDPSKLKRLERAITNATQQGGIVTDAVTTAAKVEQADRDGPLRGTFEKIFDGFSSWLLSIAVENAFDVSVSQTDMAGLGVTAGRKAVAARVTAAMVQGLTGGATSIEPSPQPAANYLTAVLHQVLEHWALGAGVEITSGVIPWVDQIQTVGDLSKGIVNALGISDSSARVLRPYIQNLVIEPLRRHLDNQYRPNLHEPGTLLNLHRRALKDETSVRAELALQGWSDVRITELIQANVRELPPADALLLFAEGQIGDIAVRHLLAGAGYEITTSESIIDADRTRRIASERRQIANAAVGAYAERQIERADLDGLLALTVSNPDERGELRTLALTRRAFNVPRLSIGDLEEAVKRNIVPLAEYRRRLALYGFNDEDILIKQLLLQAELRDAREAETRRAQLETQRKADAARVVVERAARVAEIEAQRARQRRGPLTAIKAFAVRGLVTMDTYADHLAGDYDRDIVALFVAAAEDDRADHLADLATRAELARRAEEQDLSISQLERAVLHESLSPSEYAAQLRDRGFDAGEAALLQRLVEQDLAERRELARRRAAAEAAGAVADLSLAQWDRLVRRGVRSLGAFSAALAGQGFAPDDIAALTRLLELEIADDAAATAARTAAVSAAPGRALTLAQLERLVKVGELPRREFRAELIRQRYTPEAADGITRLLDLEIAELTAQRAQRAAIDGDLARRGLSLATAERAVKEGVWTLQQFAAWLGEHGYTEEAQSVLLALLILDLEAAADKAAG